MKRKEPMVCKLDTYKMAKATDVSVVHKYLNSIQALGGGGGERRGELCLQVFLAVLKRFPVG